MTRRDFTLSLCGMTLSLSLPAQEWESMPWNEPANVRKVYLAGQNVHWPRPDLDVQKDIVEIEARLAEVERRHPKDIRFAGGELLRTDQEVGPWLDRLSDADVVLIVPLSAPTGPLAAVVDGIGVPALYFSRPYAGHSWSAIANYRKNGKKIDAIATSSYGDLDPYARIFQTVRHLRRSKVLVVAANPGGRQQTADRFTEEFGTTFRFLTYQDLQNVFDAADGRKAGEIAEQFTRGALRVVEPSHKAIIDALRFHLAVTELLKQEKANAVTVDCFGGLLQGKMPAYPCIAWSKLNDRGLYGVCEGDLASTMTQMLVTSYSGMPGFVSDPVIDVSRNEIIHAHCVAATKMKGIGGPSAPYLVRNHLETAEGATMQVLMPSGETVTVGKFADPRRFLISTAEVTGALDSDRGCRTQIRTRVNDASKMLANYSGGLHRVVFYGNHVNAVERMGRLMGFEVTQEI